MFYRPLPWLIGAMIRRVASRGWAREGRRESWYCFGVWITGGRTGSSTAMIVLSFHSLDGLPKLEQ